MHRAIDIDRHALISLEIYEYKVVEDIVFQLSSLSLSLACTSTIELDECHGAGVVRGQGEAEISELA
jgi:hypothetical protein